MIQHSGDHVVASVHPIAIQHVHHGHEHVPQDKQPIEDRVLNHVRWSDCMTLELFATSAGLVNEQVAAFQTEKK